MRRGEKQEEKKKKSEGETTIIRNGKKRSDKKKEKETKAKRNRKNDIIKNLIVSHSCIISSSYPDKKFQLSYPPFKAPLSGEIPYFLQTITYSHFFPTPAKPWQYQNSHKIANQMNDIENKNKNVLIHIKYIKLLFLH